MPDWDYYRDAHVLADAGAAVADMLRQVMGQYDALRLRAVAPPPPPGERPDPLPLADLESAARLTLDVWGAVRAEWQSAERMRTAAEERERVASRMALLQRNGTNGIH